MTASSETTSVSTNADGRAAARSWLLQSFAGELRLVPVIIVLAAICALFAWLSPVFLSPRNITFLLLQTVPIGLLSLSLIFVLFVAEIDLSLAIVSAVAAAVTAVLLVYFHWGLVPALAAGLITGGGIGAIQAAIVLFFGAPSFLVTLGGSFVLSGVLVLLLPEKSAQVSVFGTPLATWQNAFMAPWLSWLCFAAGIAIYVVLRIGHYRGLLAHGINAHFGRMVALPALAIAICFGGLIWHLNQFQGVPWMLAAFIIITTALSYVVGQTAFGRHLFAVGGNREAARRAGIHVDRVVMAAFVLAGALAAISGLAATARQLSVSSSSGGGLLLLSGIAGAVIGGASLFGGRGTVWAALLGPLIIATMSNGFDLLAAPPYLRIISIGTILVIAVVLDSILVQGRIRARRRS
jgi:D-xylose transport system permease protein